MIEWRAIPSIPAYLVSNHGQVRHRFSCDPRKQQGDRYLWVSFRGDGKNFVRTVHSLVAEAFLGPRPDGFQVRHLDGDRHNNHATNLAYGTAKENALDREWHGNTARGERNGNVKLADDKVVSLRNEYEDGAGTQRQLARRYGISQAQVWNIVNHKQRGRSVFERGAA